MSRIYTLAEATLSKILRSYTICCILKYIYCQKNYRYGNFRERKITCDRLATCFCIWEIYYNLEHLIVFVQFVLMLHLMYSEGWEGGTRRPCPGCPLPIEHKNLSKMSSRVNTHSYSIKRHILTHPGARHHLMNIKKILSFPFGNSVYAESASGIL